MFKGLDDLCATCLHWLSGSQHKGMQHVDIRVLSEDVGLSVMLEMTVIPPVCRGSLKKSTIFSIRVEFSEKNIWSGILVTFKWPMINLCTMWFQRDFLKTDRWPKSCCSHPACDFRRRRRETSILEIIWRRVWLIIYTEIIMFESPEMLPEWWHRGASVSSWFPRDRWSARREPPAAGCDPGGGRRTKAELETDPPSQPSHVERGNPV